MIHPDDALAIVLNNTLPVQSEPVMLCDALGRILSRDVISPLDVPPFAKSAMDGYAIMQDDTSESFRIIEVIAAGKIPREKVAKGCASKIMTGAMLPENAALVVPVENTREENGTVFILEQANQPHIIAAGNNIKRGDIALARGSRIRAQEIGICASLGIDNVYAAKRPLVGIISTGDEITEPGNALESGKIYNSNGPALSAQVLSMNCRAHYYGIAADTKDATDMILQCAMNECDVVILSGGVSMGDFDFVPESLEKAGITIHFSQMAIKPGKPTVFGTKENRFFFGLPGNPVSTFTIFELFVKPLLYALMGHDFSPPTACGILENDFSRKHGGRVEYRPVFLRGGKVTPAAYHGSNHLNALYAAEGLVRFEKDEVCIPKGVVNVRLI